MQNKTNYLVTETESINNFSIQMDIATVKDSSYWGEKKVLIVRLCIGKDILSESYIDLSTLKYNLENIP